MNADTWLRSVGARITSNDEMKIPCGNYRIFIEDDGRDCFIAVYPNNSVRYVRAWEGPSFAAAVRWAKVAHAIYRSRPAVAS